MKPRIVINTLNLLLIVVFTVASGGCGNSIADAEGWATGESFYLIPRSLTSEQQEKIQSVLDPDMEGLTFTDEGFLYKNIKLSDEEQHIPAKSAEDAIKEAEKCLRSLELLPDDRHYYIRTNANTYPEGACSSLFFYQTFHNVPILLKDSPEIRIGICEKGIESIRYYNAGYTLEIINSSLSVQISENDAKKKIREKDSDSEYKRNADDFKKVYVYTEGEAVPMYMFGEADDVFVNHLFVDARTGEVTDFPWKERP